MKGVAKWTAIMMAKDFELPSGETVCLVYLREFPNLGDMIYLQSIRSGFLDVSSPAAQSYLNMAPHYARQLAEAIRKGNPTFDAVVMPPSQRKDAVIYMDEITDGMILLDLSDRFSRTGQVRSATANSLDDVITEFRYQVKGEEANIQSLLIVDDSLSSGKTASALLHHLREAGLPGDCSITLAVPAWIKDPRR